MQRRRGRAAARRWRTWSGCSSPWRLPPRPRCTPTRCFEVARLPRPDRQGGWRRQALRRRMRRLLALHLHEQPCTRGHRHGRRLKLIVAPVCHMGAASCDSPRATVCIALPWNTYLCVKSYWNVLELMSLTPMRDSHNVIGIFCSVGVSVASQKIYALPPPLRVKTCSRNADLVLHLHLD